MALLLAPQPGTGDVWRRAFAAAMPELDVRICAVVRDFRAGHPLAQAVDRKRGY